MLTEQANGRYSVLLVEADPVVSEGLKLQIEAGPHFVVTTVLSTAAEVMNLPAEHYFDVAVVDEHLGGSSGGELCRLLSRRNVRHCILHARTNIDPGTIPSDGVSAVVLKQLSGSDLINALARLATS